MGTVATLAQQIQAVDWRLLPDYTRDSIERRTYPQYVTAWHPALPRTILKLLAPSARAFVGDFFCGGGVSLAEARMLGHYTVGRDTNPIAVLMSRVRTRTYDMNRLIQAIRDWKEAYLAEPLAEDTASTPEIEAHFPPLSIAHLRRAERAWHAVAPEGTEWQEWFQVALIAVMKRYSIYNERTPKPVRAKEPIPERAYTQFPKYLQRRMNAMREYHLLLATLCEDAPPATVELGDCGEVDGVFDLILTSPPYGVSYDYTQVYRYALAWLGKEPYQPHNAVEPESWPYPVREWYARFIHTTPILPYQYRKVGEFIELLGRFARAVSRTLARNGFLAVAIGDTVYHKRLLPNTEILQHWLTQYGLEPVAVVPRQLAYTRLPHARTNTGRFTRATASAAPTENLLFYTAP